MTKTCYYCHSNQVKEKWITKDWTVENRYLGTHGQILKEVLVGGVKSNEINRTPIKTVYYCSFTCSQLQADQEEKELWEKGDCSECKKPLAVINDDCSNLEHKKTGCLLPIE